MFGNKDPNRRFHGLRIVLLFLLSAGFSQGVAAHLLNMTEVELTIAPDARLTLNASVDLAGYYSSRSAYYDASKIEPCALLNRDKNITNLFLNNIRVEYHLAKSSRPLSSQSANSVDKGHQETAALLNGDAWDLVSCHYQDALKTEYLDPLQWPKVRLTAVNDYFQGRDLKDAYFRASFQPGFRYEEPIALSFIRQADEKSMTRWLITSQRSPLFSATDLEPGGKIASGDEDGEAWMFIVHGFKHILPFGLDHLLFVMALTLLATSLRKLVVMISFFTLAHSVTLIASTYGIVSFSSKAIEVLIALTIFWVGLEVCFPKLRISISYPLIFVFGLLHGLGFAGALRDIGLPEFGAVTALLTFNLGVEIGQICFVIMILAIGRIASFAELDYSQGKRALGGLVALLGVFWMAQRLSA